MNEWKELDIGNLPPDILTGNYEWKELYAVEPIWRDCKSWG